MEFVGLVQGLQVYLGFLVWEEEKTPGRENKSLGILFQGYRDELENLDWDEAAFSVGQNQLFP